MMMMTQNANSPIMESLIFFYDHTSLILLMLTFSVLMNFMSIFSESFFKRFFSENHELEYFWTTLPAFILLFLAFPSLKILYMSEEYLQPSLTIKAIGHQWYWSYEYSELNSMTFDSFIQNNNLIRLLDTSNHLIIPINTPIRMLITSEDVIHSWTIPSLGVKVDAIPGRINQLILHVNRPGILTGQCSEICGANHSFMPITISAISMNKFISSI
uniref:Cytochrome c oxidase subunit 2 n=1 Tax=Pyemotes zhonghuajia TaxID=2749944 RepID=A0A8T9JCZ2_9ACAR|nr:cytochrome c oxidase subunit II [Pyemotes zhonghuajia]UOK09674.1 cytochrome c oxidase subunit 2 [Pyemotes zhonghuajia]